MLSLTLEDSSGGYIVEEVTGLDPVKATLASSNFATMNGQQYHGSSRDIRTIQITLSYAPNYEYNWSIPELRNSLYEYFMPGERVYLTFNMDDERVLNIDGVVETCEAPLFVQEPMMVISVNCYDPDFVEEEPIQYDDFLTTDTEFTTIYLQPGTVATGFVLELDVKAAFNEFTIYHKDGSGNTQAMQFAIPLQVGDRLTINTITGQKAITLTRSNTATSAMYSVSPQSPWIQLKKGVNQLRVYAAPVTPSEATVTYNRRFGGL